MQKAKRVEILNDINVPKIIRDATPLDIPILSSDVRDIVFKNVEIRFNHYHKLGKRKLSKNSNVYFPNTKPVMNAYPLRMCLSSNKTDWLKNLEIKLSKVLMSEVDRLMLNIILVSEKRMNKDLEVA